MPAAARGCSRPTVVMGEARFSLARCPSRLASLSEAALAAGVVLLPVAAILSLIEIALGRSGTVYVEGRRGEPGH